MDSKPTNEMIAREIGISEVQVERYRRDTFLLGDGSWLIHFAYEMPKGLRRRLTGRFTLIFQLPAARADARNDNYMDGYASLVQHLLR